MDSPSIGLEALREAITIAGGQAALAKRLDGIGGRLDPPMRCKPQNVWAWLNRDGRVPAEWARLIAEAIEFQILPSRLRPDLYPHPDDGLPPEVRVMGLLEEFAEVLTQDERTNIAAHIISNRPDEAVREINALHIEVHTRAALLDAAQRAAQRNGNGSAA